MPRPKTLKPEDRLSLNIRVSVSPNTMRRVNARLAEVRRHAPAGTTITQSSWAGALMLHELDKPLD